MFTAPFPSRIRTTSLNTPLLQDREALKPADAVAYTSVNDAVLLTMAENNSSVKVKP